MGFLKVQFCIFSCDIFFKIDTVDVTSNADDNTPYSAGKKQSELEKKIQKACVKCLKWFYENGMKTNQDVRYFLSIFRISTAFLLAACILENSSSRKREIDGKWNFNEHVTNLCDTQSERFKHLQEFLIYILQTQKRLLMDTYFVSQFGYYPLVWMTHSKTLSKHINGLHEVEAVVEALVDRRLTEIGLC